MQSLNAADTYQAFPERCLLPHDPAQQRDLQTQAELYPALPHAQLQHAGILGGCMLLEVKFRLLKLGILLAICMNAWNQPHTLMSPMHSQSQEIHTAKLQDSCVWSRLAHVQVHMIA